MFSVETYLENAAFFLKLKTERTTAFIVKQRKYIFDFCFIQISNNSCILFSSFYFNCTTRGDWQTMSKIILETRK